MTLILGVRSSFPSLNLIWFLTNNWTKTWQTIGGGGRAEKLDSLNPRGFHLCSASNILLIHLQNPPQSSESHSPDTRTSNPIITNPDECFPEGLENAYVISMLPLQKVRLIFHFVYCIYWMEPLLDLLLGALTDLKENAKGRKKDIRTHTQPPYTYIWNIHTYMWKTTSLRFLKWMYNTEERHKAHVLRHPLLL